MQYIRGLDAYKNTNASAITFGKFDGLHLGHELLIQQVIELQNRENVDGIVFAFDMSPFYEKMNIEPDFLMSNEEKAKLLEGRVSYFIDCPFVEEISSMEAEAFIEEIIANKFHAKYVVVGTDFRFGYQKRGDYKMLQDYSEKFGYEVLVLEKKCHEGREISSTYIKEELKKGNNDLANYLLGHELV